MAESLRAVLVGCGVISWAWIDAAQKIDGLEIVALVDLDEEAARGRAVESGLTEALVDTDLTLVLDKVKPDIVFDCTAPNAHLEVTLEALRNGCHILGEKPMSESMEDARRMVSAAQEAGKLYAVMQQRRFDPNIRRLKRFLETGAIGPVVTVHSDFFLGVHLEGFRAKMPHVLLLDMAVHTFDQARFLSGSDAQTVYCHEWNPPVPWSGHEPSAVAIFEMDNDIVYTYRGSWCAEGQRTAWESEWRIIGEKGSVLWDGAEVFSAEVAGKRSGLLSDLRELEVPLYEGLDSPDADGSEHHHARLIRDFCGAIRTGRRPSTICTDNIKSLAMVFGAIDSAEREAKVAVPPGCE